MLIYHGWADSALSPLMTTAYIDQVYARDAGAKSNVRLFVAWTKRIARAPTGSNAFGIEGQFATGHLGIVSVAEQGL